MGNASAGNGSCLSLGGADIGIYRRERLRLEMRHIVRVVQSSPAALFVAGPARVLFSEIAEFASSVRAFNAISSHCGVLCVSPTSKGGVGGCWVVSSVSDSRDSTNCR